MLNKTQLYLIIEKENWVIFLGEKKLELCFFKTVKNQD